MKEAKKIEVSNENPGQYKTFWINSYNLAVMSGIADKYYKSPITNNLETGFYKYNWKLNEF